VWLPVPYRPISVLPTPAFPNGQDCRRPLLIVTLINGPQFLTVFALADSGADHCIFPLSFAAALGLAPLQMPSQFSAGVGSYNIPTYYSDVVLQIRFGQQGEHVVEHKIYAGFSEGMEHQGIGLLGQFGFFDHFKVAFDRKASLFFVEIPDPPATQNP
jgi:hypothetical protein